MLKNHLLIAWRSILKNKLFSFINVIGLSIGLCAAMVISSIIYYDLSFDRFHPDKDQIYRVITHFNSKDGNFVNRGVAIPLIKTFQEGESGIEHVAPFTNAYFYKVENKVANAVYREVNNTIFADDAYFKMFPYTWLAGDEGSALNNPGELVLVRSRAEKYFPNTQISEIVGKTLVYNDSVPLTITGVVGDIEQNTDLQFNEFISTASANLFGMKNQVDNDQWNNTNSSSQLFLKLKKGVNPDDVQSRLDVLAKEHQDPQTTEWGQVRSFSLQSFEEIHFDTQTGSFDNVRHQANKLLLKGLALVALFLLLLGCANFINLNSAQALTRAREIGVRKTLGSSKKQLIFQFLGETFLLTTAAAIVSALLAPMLLRQFSDFLPEGVSLSVLSRPIGISGIVVLVLVVSLLSGLYPAFVLSKFKPVLVLKGHFSHGNSGGRVRKFLTVFQFAIAQTFVIATFLVGKQLNFLMHKDMGFETKAVASVSTPWETTSETKKQAFFQKMKEIKGLEKISWGNRPPASNSMSTAVLDYFKDGQEFHQNTEILYGDTDYLSVYGIPLVAGRDRLNDSIQEYVVNEAFALALGFQNPGAIVGTNVKMDTLQIPVVGVMQNFNQRSLRSSIKPLMLRGDNHGSEWSAFNTVHFVLGKDTEKWPETLKEVEEAWTSVYPENTITIDFMDDTVKSFYSQERRTGILLQWATGLAILISCLGLLGLVIYATERRVKEIGIRKVLGANLAQLNLLLSKEFLGLIGVAFVIAVPISWYLMQKWMQGYAYKTTLSWWVFAASGIGMVLLALVVIGTKTYKTSNINPVESLRTE